MLKILKDRGVEKCVQIMKGTYSVNNMTGFKQQLRGYAITVVAADGGPRDTMAGSNSGSGFEGCDNNHSAGIVLGGQ